MRRLLLDIHLCHEVERESGNGPLSDVFGERLRLEDELSNLVKEEEFLRSQAEPKGIEKP